MNKKNIIYIVVAIVIIAIIGYLMGWFDKKGSGTSATFRVGGSTKCAKCGDVCGDGGVCIGSGDNCDNVQCYGNQYNKTQKCPHGLYWNPITNTCRPLGRG